MQNANKSTKRVTVVVSNNRKKKNKSRSKVPNGNSSSILGQQRSVPIARTTQTSQGIQGSRNYRLPRRREMISTIVGNPNTFSLIKTIILNPGDPSFSSWLANVALCYESYKFHYLKFLFVPRCSTTTSGDIFLCPDSNPKDLPPTNEIVASQNEKCKSSASWDHFDITINKEMMSKRKTYFCRKNGVLPDDADKDLYDTGNLFVFVGDQASTAKIGQLWVEYDVEFFTPEGAPSLPPLTIFGKATTGLTAGNPIVGNNFEKQQVGNAVEVQSQDGTFYAHRAFHGLLNVGLGGTGIGTANFTTTGGATVSAVEDGYNVGGIITNSSGAMIQQVLNMPEFSTVRMALSSATSLTGATMSLTNCYL